MNSNNKEWSKPTIIDLYSSESQSGTLGQVPGQEGNHLASPPLLASVAISS